MSRYREAIRARLREAGFDDLPHSSSWLLAALAHQPGSLGQLANRLGTSKQGLSRLTDVVVERGYAIRQHDPLDHRRVLLSLTEKGGSAALTISRALRDVDAEIEPRAGPGGTAEARRTLAALFSSGPEPRSDPCRSRPADRCRPSPPTRGE